MRRRAILHRGRRRRRALHSPELGGFFHFLIVWVEGETVRAEVRRLGQRADATRKISAIEPGALLETWRSSLFWCTWGPDVTKELARGFSSRENKSAPAFSQGLRIWFDFAQCEWTVLQAPFHPHQDWSSVEQACVDIYVPEELTPLAITLILSAGKTFEAAVVPLRPGWNAVAIKVDEHWIPSGARQSVREVEWHLSSSDGHATGWVVFDHFRTVPLLLQERWQGPLLWGAYDESVRPEHDPTGEGGLRVWVDLAKYPRPVLYAVLNPGWT